MEPLRYDQFRSALAPERLPAALVHLEALEANLELMLAPVEARGKRLRIASKSIRVPYLLRYLMERSRGLARGVMCFTVEEARFLAEQGHDDLLMAYPTVQAADLEILAELTGRGTTVCLVVDSASHLEALSRAGRGKGVVLRAAVELDVSFRRGRLHVGARRSPVRDPGRVLELIRLAEKLGGVRVAGIMAYEAHIAGVPDRDPFAGMMNLVARAVKWRSRPDVARLREEVVARLRREGVELEFFNGGGTGSLDSTSADSTVTEVTAGSGFYCSHLFSYFRSLELHPAAFFALQVVRSSDPGLITCLGGGYVASGPAGPNKLPIPHSPPGLQLLPLEGAGEVQTPLRLPPDAPPLQPGDPVIFRHAKAGELMERFNEVLLLREGKVVDRVPTYRGLGKCFL